jgi:hypothetical protein
MSRTLSWLIVTLAGGAVGVYVGIAIADSVL